MEYKLLAHLTAEDLAFIEASKFGVDDIARLFGVPSWILQNGQTTTFASSREASRNFAMFTFVPWCRRVKAAFQASVLGAPYRLSFDVASMTKADIDAYSASLLRLRQAGAISPNDVRSELGWEASSDPTANSIRPPTTWAAAVAGEQEKN